MSEPVTVGDLVTPENVAGLPVGTIVRWEHEDGEPSCAIRLGPDWWRGPMGGYHNSDIADPFFPSYIAYLPEGA